MTRRRTTISRWLGLGAVFVWTAGCGGSGGTPEVEITTPVTVQEATLQTIEDLLITTGTLKATEEVALKAEVEGDITVGPCPGTDRCLQEGDRVEKGQLIAKLVNDELVNRVQAAEKNKQDARNELTRIEKLWSNGDVSDAELEKARLKFEQAEIELENVQIQLEKTEIRAPIGGVLSFLAEVVEGEHIPIGMDLATVMRYDQVLASVSLSNRDVERVQKGAKVYITSLAVDKTVEAEVLRISPTVDPTTRAFETEVLLDNTEGEFKPGMFVKAEIVTATNEGQTVVIPTRIIVTRGNEDVVFIVKEQRAERRPVEIGISNKDYTEIKRGVEPDEMVIIEGFQTLRHDSRIRIRAQTS